MSTTPPLMPELAALTGDDSMLTRRFGKEVINYYAGSRLNRYSFLRSDAAFLSKAATSDSARFVVLKDLNPFVVDKRKLALSTYDDVQRLVEELFEQTDAQRTKDYDSTAEPPVLVVFLGMVDGGDAIFQTSEHGEVKGQPFFALDVTPKGRRKGLAETWVKTQEDKGLRIATDTRSLSLHSEAAAMFAQARSIIDWNTRNTFCAGCGNPNLSVAAGYKRICPPTSRKGSSGATQLADCPTRHGVSNVCFPRTDPTMIAAVVSADGQRILLGRQSRWPPHWHSALAGFLEPGESIEEAVRREVWEEAGVRVGRVVVHSTQPWPYPSSLMIGAIAQALPGDGETISLNDKELESARWFTFEEVRTALAQTAGGLGAPPPKDYKQGDLRVPPPQAIANRLMTAVVEGYLSGNPKI
ncbi:NADH pyrophosphatase [Metarhizium album ARSEF 1941]|uniref:NAD(+) diphosphatase n=1 Tax=Metarhizium album (strain ARSEF 1941) TaxID=1081103 RepID=A0A0B2X5T5_METAS|nr:NADH pyrophosphatase [Metarhizium album ARSEF 1941]KHO00671.1 NADH pyrophosphatase [Metarhizium album ARSEF 1941]